MSAVLDRNAMNFVIYSHPYNDNVGGVIALHKLCEILESLGQRAAMWIDTWPRPDEAAGRGLGHGLRLLRHRLGGALFPRLPRGQKRAQPSDLGHCIALYPEVVSGNPLGARNVARWFLNKPGRVTGEINYGENELYFYFSNKFDDPRLNRNPENVLRVFDIKTHIYRNTNPGARRGSCYMVRKGRGREQTYHPAGALCVDGWPHAKLAAAFNQHEYFFCYDLHTMYSRYAAMCGCKSVVVPASDVSRNSWRHSLESTYGIAYGLDDLAWAQRTADRIPAHNDQLLQESVRHVELFVERCRAFFGVDQARFASRQSA